MKKYLIFCLIITSVHCFSQFSKTHYVPPVSCSNSQQAQQQYMYISCPSTTPVKFRITQLGGTVIEGTVARDTPYSLDLGFGSSTQMMVSEAEVSAVMNNKGYVVEADDLVYVTVRFRGGNGNQAGSIVSKGLAALGKKYRIGAFLNTGITTTNGAHYTFASILATENNTVVSFGNIKTGVTLLNNTAVGNNPLSIVLNRGESYVYAVKGPSDPNRDGLIGSFISSDKPIAVNCGSVAGTNGDNQNNLDYGTDQIVSVVAPEREGKEYIFIKGNGLDVMERPLIVADVAGTQVFKNGSTTPVITLAAGEYYAFSGSDFSANGNLYVKTSEKVFAYQGIGGSNVQANQNMHFVPALSCDTPKIINNIPFINEIGTNGAFTGTVCIVTQTGATLSFIVNGTNYTIATLPATASGPFPVSGNPNYETYRFDGLTGNVSVFSTKQVYLSYFGSSGAATYGGFYSGFTFKPEIALSPISSTASNCIPNVKLAVNSLSSFDAFQWYKDGVPITGQISNQYTPLVPGFYSVEAKITDCPSIPSLFSDNIPVSACATDVDNDGANDNIDLDNDNDSITNCTESLGNTAINLTATTATLTATAYSNPYNSITSVTGTSATQPFIGDATGVFITEVPGGKTNSVSQKISFANPVSLSLEYPASGTTVLIDANGEYRLEVSTNKTITVLNPNDQLLIDTNYDGIFESGITSFSSFQLRFRLNNGGIPLPAGTGTFKFLTNLVNDITFTHKNLVDTTPNKVSFKIEATCLPFDSDGDGIADQNDFDSDNDGIKDVIENLGANYAVIPFVDVNKNGLNDAYENISTLDSDGDGVFNYLDLDADNDGIFDLIESGSNATDANLNGIVDGTAASFGTNGLSNSLETSTDSGTTNYTVANSDSDTQQNFIDLDSDGDNCNDVIEANFTDSNNDGILGGLPVTVNTKGVVTSGTNGYTVPTNNNYITGAPIIINTQPLDTSGCEAGNTTFTIATNTVNGYQWQLSTDNGVTFNNIANFLPYSGVNTNSLLITNATTSMNNYLYRVVLTKTGNSCGLTSGAGKFTVLPRPAVVPEITILQCDIDFDFIADFNLTQKNTTISAQAASQTFSYFTTQNGAISDDPSVKIPNPLSHNSATGNAVWARIVNSNGCFNFCKINLVVSVTSIPGGYNKTIYKCDDYLDATNNDYDGISGFNFGNSTAEITGLLPVGNYNIKYYKNEADFNAETDAAGNSLEISQNSADAQSIYYYRNIGYPNAQTIWVRVESAALNSCFGFGKINLVVEKLPIAYSATVTRQCDDNPNDAVIQHAFDTSNVLNNVLNGQSTANVDVTYFDASNNPITGGTPNNLPNPFTTETQLIKVVVTNKNGSDPAGKCFDETFIQFTVDKKPIANPVVIAKECDVDTTDNLINYNFDTSNIGATIMGTQSPADFVISYFAEDGTPLNPLPNPFLTATQKVKAIITNPLNTTCSDQTFIQFTVNELPYVDQNTDPTYYCSGTSETITLDAGLIAGNQTDYDYQWFKDGVLLPGEINYTLDINTNGTYTTTVTDKVSGCSRTRTNIVAFSQQATITNIEITDLYDANNTVVVTASGLGTYDYSIDEPNGPFQPTGIFTNVESGFHTVYVHDKNGCDTTSQEIAVLGIMPVFTPNGDSYNDLWKIRGASAKFNKKSEVFIYDRHGKLLYQITNGQSPGWDGTFNGAPMPADDYWFTLTVQDGRTLKGHFALKR
jgi:gliding motility-associated-like protein